MGRRFWRTDSSWQSLEGRLLCAAAVYAPSQSHEPVGTIQDLGEIEAQEAYAGVRKLDWLRPWEQVNYRLTLDVGADYVLWCRYNGGSVAVVANGPAGELSFTPGIPGRFEPYHVRLDAGSYLLTAEAVGTQSTYIDWELILDNGVGQTPAVALPTPAAVGVAPLDVAFTPQAAPVGPAGNIGPGPTVPPDARVDSASLALVPESMPLGGPRSFDDHLEAVGPIVEGGSSALADASPGLGPALYIPPSMHEPAGTSPLYGAVTLHADDSGSADADSATLASIEWIERIASFIASESIGDNTQPVEDLASTEVGRTADLEDRFAQRAEEGGRPMWRAEIGMAWIIPFALLAARGRRVRHGGILRPVGSSGAGSLGRSIRTHPSGPLSLSGWMSGWVRKGRGESLNALIRRGSSPGVGLLSGRG